MGGGGTSQFYQTLSSLERVWDQDYQTKHISYTDAAPALQSITVHYWLDTQYAPRVLHFSGFHCIIIGVHGIHESFWRASQ